MLGKTANQGASPGASGGLSYQGTLSSPANVRAPWSSCEPFSPTSTRTHTTCMAEEAAKREGYTVRQVVAREVGTSGASG